MRRRAERILPLNLLSCPSSRSTTIWKQPVRPKPKQIRLQVTEIEVPRWRHGRFIFNTQPLSRAMLAMEQPSYYSESQPRLASAAAVSLPRKVSFHVMATLLSFVGGDARPTFQPPAAGFLC